MSRESGRGKDRGFSSPDGYSGPEARFIGRPAEVEYAQEPGFKRPLRLRWAGDEATVQEVLDRWEDWGFGSAPPRRRHWWQRRHRTCYRVRTTDGRTLELYYDRSIRKWFITRELIR